MMAIRKNTAIFPFGGKREAPSPHTEARKREKMITLQKT